MLKTRQIVKQMQLTSYVLDVNIIMNLKIGR